MQVQRYYEPRHMSKPLQCFVCVFEDGFALLQNLERLSGNFKVMKDAQNHGKRIRLKRAYILSYLSSRKKSFR